MLVKSNQGFGRRVVSWVLIGGLLLGLLSLSGPKLPIVRADGTFDIPNGDIAALKAALNTPGTNVINLAPGGTYTLTVGEDSSFCSKTGLPVISNTITINGRGATLARDIEAAPFRFFCITQVGSLTLNNLTLFNGYVDAYNDGGAVASAGTVQLNYTTFYSNTSYRSGGAVYSIAVGSSATSVPPNQSYTATLTINYSTFISNSSSEVNGAVYSAGIGGSNNISDTNPASNGTGILKIQGSSFISNRASGAGAVTNVANGSQEIQQYKSGTGTAIAEISNSTFIGNSDNHSGSAIANYNLSYNTNFEHYGPGVAFLTVTNSTIVNNTSDQGVGAISSGKDSTGLGTATTSLRNNIIASNTGGNCHDLSNSFVGGSNNLEYGTSGSATCGTGSTVVTTDPVASLTPTNNGGPTLTILPAGPAVDNGNNTICAATPVSNLDQRGYVRPAGAACDVGAVENGGSPGLVVLYNTDNGDNMTIGTLSYALKHATNGQPIAFALANGPMITVSGPLPPLLPNARLGTGCDGIVILGTGVAGDGLTLSGNNMVKGVTVKGFWGRQIVTAGTGSQLFCTKASKN